MNSAYFDGRYFNDFESEMWLITATKHEYSDYQEFSKKCLEYLKYKDFLWDNRTVKELKHADNEDVEFLKSNIDTNLKYPVMFDMEKITGIFTFEQEDTYEHMLILCTENNYMMLFWHTLA